MSTSDPYGQPPSDELVDLAFPEDSEDSGAIGKKNEDGVFIPGKLITEGRCIGVDQRVSKSGNNMTVFTFVGTGKKFAGTEFDLYCVYLSNAKFKLIETHQALNIPEGPFKKPLAIGVYVTMDLEDEEYNGKWRAKLKGVRAHDNGAGYRGKVATPF